MSEPPRFRLVDVVLLLIVLATAAGTRVGYLRAHTDDGNNAGPFLVQESAPEQLLIDNVRDYRWFAGRSPLGGAEERTAWTAPGYPWLLGELHRLLRPEAVGPMVRWLQCGLGTLTAGFWFLFAHRAFPGRAVALLTGLFCALHPFWIINTAAINDGTLAAFLLGGCAWLGARGGQAGGPLTSLLYGAGLAALALVRAALLPFAVVAVLWYLWRCRRLTGGSLAALLAFLGFVTALSPWTIFNVQDEPIRDVLPIVDSTYYHLWMGNNPRATGGPLPDDALRQALAEAAPDTAADLDKRPEAERYRSLAGPAVQWVLDYRVDALQRRLWAGLYFFFGEDWFTRGELWATPQGSSGPEYPLAERYTVLLTGSLLAMLLLGMLGWRWSYGWRREGVPASLALMWVPLPYLLSHAEALSGPRLPLDGVLLCYTAVAVVYVLPVLGRPLRAGGRVAAEEI